ncbi:MAG: hypothetical protein QNJ73_00845 [Gammaproteobacteria bacterium]|nr:hypothetical protein [Gammaproteobacteria bacterium]
MAVLLASFASVPAQEVMIEGNEADDWGSYDDFDDYYGDDYYGDDPYADGGEQFQPFAMQGDGMTLIVLNVDPGTGDVRGTVRIGQGPDMQLQMQSGFDEMGRNLGMGQVQTPQGLQPFRIWDDSEETSIAEFNGRRYRLVFQYDESGVDAYANERTEPYRGAPTPEPETQPAPPPKQDRQSKTRSAPNLGNKTYVLERKTLTNTHTLLVPQGWKAEGGVYSPPPQAYRWSPSRSIKVSSPDGAAVMFEPAVAGFDTRPSMGAIPPEGSFERGNMVIRMPPDMQTWAQVISTQVIPQQFPQAKDIRVTESGIVPELTAHARRAAEPMMRLVDQSTQGLGSSRDISVFFFLAAYEDSGKKWDHYKIFTRTFAMLNNEFGHNNFWGTADAVSVRAPQGELQDYMPVFLVIINSLRLTPRWEQELMQTKAKIMGIDHQTAMGTLRGMMQASNIMYAANQEVSNMQQSGYMQRSESQARGQRDFVNSIRDVHEFADPQNNRNVAVSIHWDNVYSNGSDQYVLSNDPSFDPNRELQGSWQQLSRAGR